MCVCHVQTPALTPFPDLTQPEVAFPLYPHPEIDPRLVTHMDSVYLQNLDMPELIEKARVAVIGHATALLKAEPQRNVDYVVLDLPCTFFMLRSLRSATTLPAPSCRSMSSWLSSQVPATQASSCCLPQKCLLAMKLTRARKRGKNVVECSLDLPVL